MNPMLRADCPIKIGRMIGHDAIEITDGAGRTELHAVRSITVPSLLDIFAGVTGRGHTPASEARLKPAQDWLIEHVPSEPRGNFDFDMAVAFMIDAAERLPLA